MPRPRIGRPDVLALDRARAAGLAAPDVFRTPAPPPARDLDDVVTRAREIADGLARLQRLSAFVKRRLRRGSEYYALRAQLDALQDRAGALWLELVRLAREASARGKVEPGSAAMGEDGR